MSNESQPLPGTFGATIARTEAATHENSPPSAALTRDLIDLAAAIEWVEAELAAGGAPAPDGLAAVERIQDLAFALRERKVDPTICDALEAATREAVGAVARSEATEARAQSGAALLRVLSRQVHAMIGLAAPAAESGAKPPPRVVAAAVVPPASKMTSARDDEAAADGAADRETPQAPELAEAEAREDEHFAQAVGALAASFSPPAPAGEMKIDRSSGLIAAAASSDAAPKPDHGILKSDDGAAPGSSSEPLAALDALSEEELIALFS